MPRTPPSRRDGKQSLDNRALDILPHDNSPGVELIIDEFPARPHILTQDTLACSKVSLPRISSSWCGLSYRDLLVDDAVRAFLCITSLVQHSDFAGSLRVREFLGCGFNAAERAEVDGGPVVPRWSGKARGC